MCLVAFQRVDILRHRAALQGQREICTSFSARSASPLLARHDYRLLKRAFRKRPVFKNLSTSVMEYLKGKPSISFSPHSRSSFFSSAHGWTSIYNQTFRPAELKYHASRLDCPYVGLYNTYSDTEARQRTTHLTKVTVLNLVVCCGTARHQLSDYRTRLEIVYTSARDAHPGRPEYRSQQCITRNQWIAYHQRERWRGR